MSATRPAALIATALCLAASASSPLRAGDGEARLASGAVARYSYHFDRNALIASRDVDDALIAVTRSGNLLRFDRATFKVTHERVAPASATCLGRGEGDAVLAGFDDGRVCRVDPATLALVEVARLPGRVQWVGYRTPVGGGRAGFVAVVETSTVNVRRDVQYQVFASVVHDLVTGRTIELPRIQHGSVSRAGGATRTVKGQLRSSSIASRDSGSERSEASGVVGALASISSPGQRPRSHSS
jgi:hypothetical protein